jgi:hypothetical protein
MFEQPSSSQDGKSETRVECGCLAINPAGKFAWVGGTLFEQESDQLRTVAFISLNSLTKQFETKAFKKLLGLAAGLTKLIFLDRSVASETCVACDSNKHVVVLAQQASSIALLHKISVHSDRITDLFIHQNQVFVASLDKSIVRVSLNLQNSLIKI